MIIQSYEDRSNNVIRDDNGNIIEARGFKPGELVVFDRSIGGYSDAIFKIKEFFDQTIMGHKRAYIHYYDGMAPIDDFFRNGGFRKATTEEIKDFEE